jgi:hypothetical protein
MSGEAQVLGIGRKQSQVVPRTFPRYCTDAALIPSTVRVPPALASGMCTLARDFTRGIAAETRYNNCLGTENY